MVSGARRLLLRCQLGHLRRGLTTVCAGLALLASVATDAQTAQPLVSATYAEPTTRYPHGVLGDTIEHGALELRFRGSNKRHVIRLPESRVFEDTAPRLVDVDGDGLPEVVVVESHQDKGARLAVYTSEGLLVATPYIGTRNRWLAPIAIADMDRDGAVELAYIDRPHLAKTLRIWRYADGALVSLASLGGLTNHRIGETDIAGGLRECGNGPEMIVASANWARLIAVTFDGSTLTAADIGPHKGRTSFAKALSCD